MELYELYTEENRKFEFIKTRSKNKKERFVSVFIKILDDAYIISTPKFKGKSCKLKLGEKVNLHLYTPEGIFNLACTVAQMAQDCIKVRLTDGVIHSQRRQFARVGIAVPMRIKTDEDKKTNVYDVKTINMCAQGVNFHINKPLEGFGKTQVKFTIKNRLIQTFASLAYCNHIYKAQDEGDEDVYSCGLHFTSINQLNVNFLARECFMFEIDKKKVKDEDNKTPEEPTVTIDENGIMTI